MDTAFNADSSEYIEADATETIEVPRIDTDQATGPSSNPSIGQEMSNEDVSGNTVTVATRRHILPMFLPFLTMIRYCTTIHLGDIVTTSFANPGIHHSAVRNLC